MSAPSAAVVALRTPLPGRVAALLTGTASAALLLGGLMLHPAGLTVCAIAVACYVGLLAWRPHAWLFVLPTALPVASFAQWTGGLYVEEFDLLILTTAAFGYFHWALGRSEPLAAERHVHPSLVGSILVALLTVSYAIAAARGLLPLPGLDPDALASYNSRWNSLRILKAFAFALLIWPLAYRTIHLEGKAAIDRIALGLAGGLAVVSIVAVWERIAFPGLTNMSSDYRITALFWEMHVGGAALDGFLALTLPFSVWWMLRPGRPLHTLAAVLLFAMASYVCLVTFSRGVYAAYAAVLVVLGVLLLRSPTASRSMRSVRPVALAAFLIACAPMIVAFHTSGYRGLAAIAGVAAAIALAGDALRSATGKERGLGLLVAALLAAAAYALFAWVWKGAYIAYALSAAIFVASWWLATRSMAGGQSLVIGTLGAMAVSAVLIAQHWGGDVALRDMFIAICPLLILSAWNTFSAEPLWRVNRAALVPIAGGLIMVCIAAVGAGSYYMAERFSQVGTDLDGRFRHWEAGIDTLRTTGDRLFGKGLGRFPATYFWEVPEGERPGSHRIVVEDGNAVLLLGGPRHVLGYGEVYRVGQEVNVGLQEALVVLMDVRSDTTAALAIEICQKHLLYNGPCYRADARIAAQPGKWQQIRLPMPGQLESTPWYAPRLTFFSMGLLSAGVSITVDNIQLLGASGRNLLDNGGLDDGPAHWFFTSDRHHLPWHIKNLWLNYLFDQGWFGVAAFSLALLAALGRTVFARARFNPVAPYLAASLVGFAVVGLFDSLVDVPRLAFLFFMLLFLALFLGSGRAASQRSGTARE